MHVTRTQRTGPAKPTREPPPGPAWPSERHSGEGSASALEILQKLEQQRRDDDQSVEPRAAKSRMPEPEGGT